MKFFHVLVFAVVACAWTAAEADERGDAIARSRAAILARAAQIDALVMPA